MDEKAETSGDEVVLLVESVKWLLSTAHGRSIMVVYTYLPVSFFHIPVQPII